MSISPIMIHAQVAAPSEKVWDYYVQPVHITNWNFANDDWYCPSASNDLRVGGKYVARMEAKDGSFGFDFEATYTEIQPGQYFSYLMEDGRRVQALFEADGPQTNITITFDPEIQHSIALQRAGWQAILDNFKGYVESM